MSTATITGLEQKTAETTAYVYNGKAIQNWVDDFLTVVTEANWNLMYEALNSTGFQALLNASNVRLLITVADGTVAYDSSRPTRNSWANFRLREINDNHNTRPEILLALLGNSGVGVANRYSTSVNKVDMNYATRYGLSTTYPLGCYRLSQSLA
jgi:hypothetical protein